MTADQPKSFPYKQPPKSIDDVFRSFAEDRAVADRVKRKQAQRQSDKKPIAKARRKRGKSSERTSTTPPQRQPHRQT